MSSDANETARVTDAAPSLESVLAALGVPSHHVRSAKARAEATGEPMTSILLDYGFLSPERTAQAIARLSRGFGYFSRQEAEAIDAGALERAGARLARFSGYVPVGVDERSGALVVAVPEPAASVQAANELRGRRLRFVIASRHTIERVYRRFFADTGRQIDEALERARRIGRAQEAQDDPEALRDVLGSLLRHACYSMASDLYFHSTGRIGVVKMAVDGVSRALRVMPLDLYGRLWNRIAMDARVREEDLRQGLREGTIDFGGREQAGPYADLLERYSFRLELGLAKSGPTAVVRILDRQAETAELAALGFAPRVAEHLRRYARSGHGLVLITGPTGSGKTTTLYAMLKEIDPEAASIQSIEFPVEYQHGLWMQYELPSTARDEGEEMGRRLKGLLRNAPNVILIGEIRDEGVARTTLDAAHTGHLVFSTLHTNSAAGALLRLRRLGVPGEDLGEALLGVLAQRLARKLCPGCREPDRRAETAGFLSGTRDARPMRPRDGGCAACGGTGYRGRVPIYELLHVTHVVRELIERGAPVMEIEREGVGDKGSMWNMGLDLVAEGVISIDELLRVARPRD